MSIAPRLLYTVNHAGFFLSHRLPLAIAARDAGYEVHIATPPAPPVADIQAAGFPHHPYSLTRRGLRPWQEVATLYQLYMLYRRLKPDLVHLVTAKPNLYGGIAARAACVPAVVQAVTGMGHVFISQDWCARLLRVLVRAAYRLAMEHPNLGVIFQNPDDRALFVENRLVTLEQTVLIKGSGVDMARFIPQPEPVGPPVVVLASRMLWTKGVGEFVATADQLRMAGVEARFVLAGSPDPDNPASVTAEQLQQWHESGTVEWLGFRKDMPAVFAKSHIVCLPSSYGEGIPKVLIEAAACGRAIVTTDTPGCREIVRDGENGLLVPVGDANALASALYQLIEEPTLRQQMGTRSRAIAEADFSLNQVISETMALYAKLLKD